MYGGLPAQYLEGLQRFVGDPATYYATRGNEAQAKSDYNNMLYTWSNRTGIPATPDDWSRIWGGLNAYKSGYTTPSVPREWNMSDAFNYLTRMLAAAPQQPQIAYLKTGEI